MDSSTIWKERDLSNKSPYTIKDIAMKGPMICEKFNLGILRDTRTTTRTVIFEFELQSGVNEPIKYDAFSLLTTEAGKKNFKMLEKHHSYIVKGVMNVHGWNIRYDRASSSNSRYKIFLDKIEIIAKDDASMLSKQIYVTMDDLRKYIMTRKYGKFDMQNIGIVEGELYRYWGCEICRKSVYMQSSRWQLYYCTQCQSNGVRARICTIARNIKIQDVTSQTKTVSGLIIYHNDIEAIWGEEIMAQICTSFTDEDAKHEFQKLIGRTFTCDILHQEPSSTSIFRNASVILKNIRWATPTSIVPSREPESQSDPEADEDDSPSNVAEPPKDRENIEIASTRRNKDVAILICEDCKELDDNEYDEDDAVDSDNGLENEICPTIGRNVVLGPSNKVAARLPPATASTMNRLLDDENMDCSPDSDGDESGIYESNSSHEDMHQSGTYKLSGSAAGPGHYGLAMIINIDSEVRQKKRPGSLKDVAALEKVFSFLKIDIFQGGTIHNPSLTDNKKFEQDFSTALQEFKAELINKDYGSCFVVYMGHGLQNVVSLGDGKTINVYKDIMWEFSERQFNEFREKPKVFIFASCQGVPESPQGFELETTAPMANMLWVTPALPGQKSKRNKLKGTYFIQTLVKSLRKFRNKPLYYILQKMQNVLKWGIPQGYFIPNVHTRCFDTFLFPTEEKKRRKNR